MDKMEEKLSNMSPEQLSQNAQHIWQMLDDMAENNPAMYRKFIDKQMSESKKVTAKPNPHMCVQTMINEPQKISIFINIFDWTRVPEPKSDADPIPVMGGPMYDGKDDTGVYKIVTVAFNPKVTTDFGIDSQMYAERRMLIHLAIDFLQDQHKCTISRDYTLLPKSKRYKGTIVKAIATVSERVRKQDQAVEKEIGELENMFGPLTNSDKDSLMGQLSNITVTEEKESKYVLDDEVPFEPSEEKENSSGAAFHSQSSKSSSPSSNISSNIQIGVTEPSDLSSKIEKDIKLPGSVKRTKESGSSLIQEVGVPNGKRSLIEPEYTTDMKTCEDSRSYVIRIQLPGVKSVAECQLDISKKDLHLLVEDQFELTLPFNESVDDLEAKAKYSKKSSALILTLPIS